MRGFLKLLSAIGNTAVWRGEMVPADTPGPNSVTKTIMVIIMFMIVLVVKKIHSDRKVSIGYDNADW